MANTYSNLRLARDTTIHRQSVGSATVDVAFREFDGAQAFLVLHGGGGPETVSAFGAMLAMRKHTRVITPTHPGFAGRPRPVQLTSVVSLARTYLDLLAELRLSDVTVIGNSLGGWIAAEMGLANNGRVSGLILIDSVGAVVPGHPTGGVAELTLEQLATRSFHRPEQFYSPSVGVSVAPWDKVALSAYAGRGMGDPTLLERLAHLELPDLPVHVIWGESDRIADPDYGRAMASAIPGAHFTLLPTTGHMPQLETPEELLGAIWDLGTR
jgi:pimeloyl-ACP methyl ester carboxylesterase